MRDGGIARKDLHGSLDLKHIQQAVRLALSLENRQRDMVVAKDRPELHPALGDDIEFAVHVGIIHRRAADVIFIGRRKGHHTVRGRKGLDRFQERVRPDRPRRFSEDPRKVRADLHRHLLVAEEDGGQRLRKPEHRLKTADIFHKADVGKADADQGDPAGGKRFPVGGDIIPGPAGGQRPVKIADKENVAKALRRLRSIAQLPDPHFANDAAQRHSHPLRGTRPSVV